MIPHQGLASHCTMISTSRSARSLDPDTRSWLTLHLLSLVPLGWLCSSQGVATSPPPLFVEPGRAPGLSDSETCPCVWPGAAAPSRLFPEASAEHGSGSRRSTASTFPGNGETQGGLPVLSARGVSHTGTVTAQNL